MDTQFKKGDLVYDCELDCVFKFIEYEYIEITLGADVFVESIVRSCPWKEDHRRWKKEVYLESRNLTIATQEQLVSTLAKKLQYGV